MSEQRKITAIEKLDGFVYTVGEENVEAISFRKHKHKTFGHSGLPCYVVRYVDNDEQTIIPLHSMAEYTTVLEKIVDEDVGNAPKPPEE